jgi:hypothetical protein
MPATPATQANWADAIDASVRKKIDTWTGDVPEEVGKYFTVKDTDRETESILTTGDLGAAEPFTGQIAFEGAKQNYRKNISMVEYVKGTSIQYRLIKTQQVAVVESSLKALSRALPLRWITSTYAWANLGFSTFTVGDTLALYHTAHTSNVGGSNQGNLGTSELAYSSVDATVVLMKKFNSPNDQPLFDRKPDAIWVPSDMCAYANEIVGSKGKPDAVTNNTNYYYGQFDVIESRVIADTNNWGMLNKARMKEAMYWFNVEKKLTLKDKELSSLVSRWVVYSFYGIGCADPFWTYGHAVS